MKVKVYRNLHRRMFSIMDYKTRKVIDHKHFVVIRNAEFKVSEAGRQRVLREKKKNVHAFVVGEKPDNDYFYPEYLPVMVYYNPYKFKSFVNKKTKKPIYKADLVFLDSGGDIYAWNKGAVG